MASTRFPCAQTLSKTSNSLLRSYLLALMASNSLPTSRLGYRFTRNCSSSTAPVRTLDYEVYSIEYKRIAGNIFQADR
ncbi:hypothetical protein SDJN02_09436 [Cucurbita argyrosperma subsp. argyrosperma]|nr:hypothetical protein SDJN02_09436 [Cucurbita argyrosperma subsp. argyrosperma]